MNRGSQRMELAVVSCAAIAKGEVRPVTGYVAERFGEGRAFEGRGEFAVLAQASSEGKLLLNRSNQPAEARGRARRL